MKQNFMNTKTMTLATLAALTLSLNAGAVSAANSPVKPAVSVNQTATSDHPMSAGVIGRFEELVAKQGQLPKAIAYLNAHFKDVTKPQATIMVLHLENAIKKQLPSMERRFEKNSVQQAIGKAYKRGDSFDNVIKRITSSSVKALLKEARDSGYKLETAEGFYFPVIDYSKFKIYSLQLDVDIKAYIDIMAVESDQAKLKDAAIVIGYQQLVNRALSQESFVSKYPYSNRVSQIRNLFHSYKILTFYGANNTPLFDYDTKVIQPNALKGYTMILQWNNPESSAYLTTLQQFMELLAANNNKLTPEVEKFRKTNVPNN
ncbi:hypothetical protein [Cohnella silvisoli]|uniref:SbsC C-terminal domain-containing protein n=1 Tax=Cohnella silvisoli TaxID=2873699 RepID=A0ABV1L1C5_9BACL|nr:hypothetical protein [Cohnella silvisoli]MCD9025540.1 hypothetical protein [Cohnella silvisoli]